MLAWNRLDKKGSSRSAGRLVIRRILERRGIVLRPFLMDLKKFSLEKDMWIVYLSLLWVASSVHICSKCKFFRNDYFRTKYGKCTLFPTGDESIHFLITGKKNAGDVDYFYCSTARQYDDLCGPAGRLYQDKKVYLDVS